MSGMIRIEGLKLRTRIGVPDEERAEWQELRADVEIKPRLGFAEMEDRIEATVDYHAVCVDLEELAATGERRLIETLAEEMARRVVEKHGAAGARVRLR